MDTQRGTLHTLARHLVLALEPLKLAVAGLPAFRTMLYRLGWDVKSLPPEYTALTAKVDAALAALNGLGDNPTPAQIFDVLDEVKELYTALKGITNAPEGVDAAEFLPEIGQSLFELLLADYLNEAFPSLYSALLALDILAQRYVEETNSRPGVLLTRFQWEEVPKVVTDPGSIPARVYGWGTDDVDFHRLAGHLLEFFVARNWPAYIGRVDRELGQGFKDSPDDPATSIDWGLKIPALLDNIAGEEIEVGIALLELPAQGGKPAGLILQPLVPAAIGTSFDLTDELRLELRAGSDVATTFGVLLRPGDISVKFPFQEGAELPSAGFGLGFDYSPERSIIVLGRADATRLEFDGAEAGLATGLAINYLAGNLEVILSADLRGLSLVVAPGEGDSFLRHLLGDEEQTIDVPLGVEWSSERGIHFKGGGGFEVEVPVHLDVGLASVQAIHLQLKAPPNGAPGLQNFVGVNATGHLGPLTATVEDIGLRLDLTFVDGNAGPFGISVGFKRPTTIGLAVDGGGFKGGGFLSFDPDNARYAGFLELEYQDRMTLKALGLLTTRLPDGSEDFSLLIVITAEFTRPIQLGFGFNLSGVGGLLGLNHTAHVERLRTGIKDNTLSSVLFPEDVVANASRIISDLRQVFPPQPDRFIFGPVGRINWGTPPLMTIDLGLLIEVPDPVRLVIVGVLKASLPEETSNLLQLQVNFLGVIDFQKELLAFDASLFDSRLLSYPLSGDMAARLSWGADPNLLLSVGGFHPAYQPPPLNLPALARLSLQLLGGNNPRLRLEIYLAVTSNTRQFGARLELYAAAGKFNIYGFLAFDVLFQFPPFYFIADIGAMLALRVGSSSIASIKLSMSLEGPTPWHAQGTAKLKLFWFLTVKVRFDKTFGELLNIILPDVAVLPLLREALSDRGNWQAQMPTGRQQLVSFKATDEDTASNEIVADPFGVLTIAQKVVPLNAEIQKFGDQAPSDGNRFGIEQVRIGPPDDRQDLDSGNVKEQFAPAQFFEMSDAQKLSAKSFEHYDAGVKITESEELAADYAAQRDVEYELFYMDRQREMLVDHWPEPVVVDGLAFSTWAVGGAIAASPLSHASRAKSALAPDAVEVLQEPYMVVTVGDLRPVNGDGAAASEAEAIDLMRELIRDNPGLEGEIQVVPTFEVNRA